MPYKAVLPNFALPIPALPVLFSLALPTLARLYLFHFMGSGALRGVWVCGVLPYLGPIYPILYRSLILSYPYPLQRIFEIYIK